MAAREADGWLERVAGTAEREVSTGCVRRDDDGAGGGSSEAGRAHEGDDGGIMGCEGVDGKTQLGTTGLGPRGMRVRY